MARVPFTRTASVAAWQPQREDERGECSQAQLQEVQERQEAQGGRRKPGGSVSAARWQLWSRILHLQNENMHGETSTLDSFQRCDMRLSGRSSPKGPTLRNCCNEKPPLFRVHTEKQATVQDGPGRHQDDDHDDDDEVGVVRKEREKEEREKERLKSKSWADLSTNKLDNGKRRLSDQNLTALAASSADQAVTPGKTQYLHTRTYIPYICACIARLNRPLWRGQDEV